jgi:hypothetical protein
MDVLGNSFEEILIEKMGILKTAKLAVAGYDIPNKFILENFCKDLKIPLYVTEKIFDTSFQ